MKLMIPMAALALALSTLGAAAQSAPAAAAAAANSTGARAAGGRAAGGIGSIGAAASGTVGSAAISSGVAPSSTRPTAAQSALALAGGRSGLNLGGNTGVVPGVQATAPIPLIGVNTQITLRQAKILFYAVRSPNIQRTKSVNFTVQQGLQIPATTRLTRLPQSVIQAFPLYRNLRYFAIDNNLIVVDPASFVIIDILPG